MSGPASQRPTGIWDLVDRALDLDGATRIHLSIGRPPMVRLADRSLRPLDETMPPLTYQTVQFMLSQVVEPERWEGFERTGEGEIQLAEGGGGRRISLALFRSSEAWSAVIHL